MLVLGLPESFTLAGCLVSANPSKKGISHGSDTRRNQLAHPGAAWDVPRAPSTSPPPPPPAVTAEASPRLPCTSRLFYEAYSQSLGVTYTRLCTISLQELREFLIKNVANGVGKVSCKQPDCGFGVSRPCPPPPGSTRNAGLTCGTEPPSCGRAGSSRHWDSSPQGRSQAWTSPGVCTAKPERPSV